jgi:hypothetical protein
MVDLWKKNHKIQDITDMTEVRIKTALHPSLPGYASSKAETASGDMMPPTADTALPTVLYLAE